MHSRHSLGGGRLSRGEFARLAYVLGRRQLSGTLIIHERSLEHRVVVRRGYLTQVHIAGHFAPLGRMLRDAGVITSGQLKASLEQLASGPALQGRVLAGMGAASPQAVRAALEKQVAERLERLAAMHEAVFVLRPPVSDEVAPRGGVPLALAPWAYAHLAARFAADLRSARRQCLVLAREEIRLDPELAPGLLEGAGALERRLVALLVDRDAPLPFDRLALPGAAPDELLPAIALLSHLGALVPDRSAWRRAFQPVPVPAPAPAPAPAPVPPAQDAFRRLGLSPSASTLEVKQAFRRLARTLHPDTHPRADAATRRRLEQRFAEVSDAYREALAAAPT